MLTGSRYLLALTDAQTTYTEQVARACRAVWNVALEQRRAYRQRGSWINYAEQARQMAEAKKDPDCAWLAEVPSHTLQQTLRDLDRACREHGTRKVRWQSKARTAPSFRFPDPNHITVKRLNWRWGAVKLPKFGWVRFRGPGLPGAARGGGVVGRRADRLAEPLPRGRKGLVGVVADGAHRRWVVPAQRRAAARAAVPLLTPRS